MNRYPDLDFESVRTALYFHKIFTGVFGSLSKELPLYRAMPNETCFAHISFSLYITHGLVNKCLIKNRERLIYEMSKEELEEMVYGQITPEIIDNCVAYQVERYLSKNDIKVSKKK